VIFRRGDMFTSKSDLILFTSNGVIKSDRGLVMGAGAALQALNRFHGCDRAFGEMLINHHRRYSDTRYGVFIHPTLEAPALGAFQVKYDFWEKADLNLIAYSTGLLTAMALTDWKDKIISLNFPGVGLGGLTKDQVLPVIQSLPDNVQVWELT